eukprot:63984_1
MSETKDIIDTKIFNINDKKCNGYNDCSFMTRITTTLSYYEDVSSQQPQKFIAFCDKYYSKQYLEDYIHCISVHKNDIYKDDMENKTKCTTVTKCASTNRHYRDRAVKDENNNNFETSHLYFDIFDTFHFYKHHMEECGLRVSINLDDFKDSENENEHINC